MKRTTLIAIALASALASSYAAAQASITVTTQPYQDGTPLPFAPPARPGASAPAPDYSLKTGQPIHLGIKAWADKDGWMLVWQPTVSWKTLRDARFEAADAAAAISEVIDILRDEGKPVALRISSGNKVMEVVTTEVRND